MEFEYHTPPHAQIPSTRFKRIVYTNNNLITIDFWLLTDQQQDQIEANKDKFFGSLLLNTNINSSPEKESMELQENPAYNTGYAVGYFVGKFIFAIVLIGLAIVLFLLVRYLIRRSKNKKSNAIKSKETFKTEDKIICTKCEGENKSDVKYCSHCGYELHKG